jgi:hypothetical protein
VQGALPDGDAEADALLRGVKSKAMYGRVREEVDRMKVRYPSNTILLVL